MNCRLLIGAEEFLESMRIDLAEARDYVYLQVLNFEADGAGRRVSELFRTCPAADRRLIVDEYVRYMISDRFIYSPRNLRDNRLQEEARGTRTMLRQLDCDGISVRMTNPFGFGLARFPQRNHKKMLLIDDRYAYIGGINVADHNFLWHDFMLRITDAEITRILRQDFCRTWTGQPVAAHWESDGIELLMCDGRTNRAAFEKVFGLIRGATKSVWIQSPYLSFPFFEHLRAARQRGVNVDVVAPSENNKPLFDEYTAWEASQSGLNLWLLPPPMTHMKAMLIDDSHLVVGSANFDYLSLCSQQELIGIISDRSVIAGFVERVVEPDMSRAQLATEVRPTRGRISAVALKLIGVSWTGLLSLLPPAKSLVREPLASW